MNRVDLICLTYKKNEADGKEQTYLEVIKGTPSGGTPQAPAYTTGNILDGAVFNQMPLYKVTINGVVLSSIEKLFETQPSINQKIEQEAERYAAQYAEKIDAYKKEGTYTGDSSTSKSIRLAESGNLVYIYDDTAMFIIGIYGGIRKVRTDLQAVDAGDARFINGVLIISGTVGASALNLYGTAYHYQVL